LTAEAISEDGDLGAKSSLAPSSLASSGGIFQPTVSIVQVTSYCLPGRKEDLKQTVATLQTLYEAIHAILNVPLPYPQLRIVFVGGNLRLSAGCCGAGIIILRFKLPFF